MPEGGVRGAAPVRPSGRWDVDDMFFRSPWPYAEGGSVSTITVGSDTYRVHEFSSSGTLVIRRGGFFEYLMVGGGASANTRLNATASFGGGAGGYVNSSGYFESGDVTVIVGAGGLAGVYPTNGASYGNSSYFGSIVAYRGATRNTPDPSTVGSAGGETGSASLAAPPGTSTSGQGNDGGFAFNSANTSERAGGGGGGAGSEGGNATNSVGGNGGAGVSSSFTGTSVGYAGGGGGGAMSGTGGSATHGGGAGNTGSSAASDGVDGTGGGGGGTGQNGQAGNGGNGIVIVRYQVPS